MYFIFNIIQNITLLYKYSPVAISLKDLSRNKAILPISTLPLQISMKRILK